MVDSILVVDDDTLMHPSLAVALEQTGHLRSSAASAEQALTLIQLCPPELIFLTARRTKLDQVLGSELEADGNVGQPFDWGVQLAHVKTAVANQLASAAARRRQVWVSAAFAVGVLLLVLAAPRWMGWVQTIATYEPPTADMVWNWLTHLMFDPATTFNSLLSQTVQTWLNPSGQIDVLTTLGIIVLAVASVAGLTQLLGDKLLGAQYLVPIEQVSESTSALVHLGCTRTEIEKLEPFVQAMLLPGAVPFGPYGPGEYLTWSYAYPEPGFVILEKEHVPPGELALRHGARVRATDGDIGRVDEFLIDPANENITHVVLREGHAWSPKDVTIPVSAIDHIEEDTVYLKLDKHTIEAMPAVPLKRRA
jgi:hypothetical protein